MKPSIKIEMKDPLNGPNITIQYDLTKMYLVDGNSKMNLSEFVYLIRELLELQQDSLIKMATRIEKLESGESHESH